MEKGSYGEFIQSGFDVSLPMVGLCFKYCISMGTWSIAAVLLQYHFVFNMLCLYSGCLYSGGVNESVNL